MPKTECINIPHETQSLSGFCRIQVPPTYLDVQGRTLGAFPQGSFFVSLILTLSLSPNSDFPSSVILQSFHIPDNTTQSQAAAPELSPWQLSWHPFGPSNTPCSLPPQGPYTCYIFRLQCCSFPSWFNQLLFILRISSRLSPPQRRFLWPLCLGQIPYFRLL